MDIFHRTPAIPEDTLCYIIYPPNGSADKASVITFAACIQSYFHSLLPGFLWHRDAFELKAVVDADSKKWNLEGRMRVGDCVDDEWCTVWLLREVSSKWGVVISIFDSDGEFLLIEAADALPTWVKPTNTENRVWIYNSHLHLIPLSHISPPSRKYRRRRLHSNKESDDEGGIVADEPDEDFISAEDAVKLVQDASVDTRAPLAVESTVWRRISGYPALARDHIHVTKAYLPVDIARALVVNASLVQKPVETFYTRDAIQLRAAHRMSRFPPQPSILVTVKMTRTAYAQLIGQKFFPPKIFGRWLEKEGTNEWRWRDIGMKIASGFEMLYQESKGRTDISRSSVENSKASSDAKTEALQRNTDYAKYIENLTSVGYFRGEVQGSQLWKTLEDKAATIFIDSRREDDASRRPFAAVVNEAVSQMPNEHMSLSDEPEDCDGWLNIDAQNFDSMLEQAMGSSNNISQLTQHLPTAMDVDQSETEEKAEDRLATEQASRLRTLASKVEEFIGGEGDLEGAKFEDEEVSDEEFSDDTMSTNSEGDEEEEDAAARRVAIDMLVPGIDASEYGQMPASFHSNSQRTAPTTITTDVVELITKDSTSTPEAHAKSIRQPILPRDKYDGVDSDDETDEEGEDGDDEEEEDRPQVVGDVEVDMTQEEDEFLEFSRQALGISDNHWQEIIRDRKSRGVFVPSGIAVAKPHSTEAASPTTNEREGSKGGTPAPGPRPYVNPNLDSFESVMKALDVELARSKVLKPNTKSATLPLPGKGKGKAKAPVTDESEDIEAAMDAELKAALEGEEDGEYEGEEPMDYNLIKNFLESFKSQGGLSGPVSNLAGRLQPGWNLPRDS